MLLFVLHFSSSYFAKWEEKQIYKYSICDIHKICSINNGRKVLRQKQNTQQKVYFRTQTVGEFILIHKNARNRKLCRSEEWVQGIQTYFQHAIVVLHISTCMFLILFFANMYKAKKYLSHKKT